LVYKVLGLLIGLCYISTFPLQIALKPEWRDPDLEPGTP
jgi:hypothetical protein